MKIIFSLTFIFFVVFSFGQTITVKEYDYETATFGGEITTKIVVPGDTITLGITILETSKNDFNISPYTSSGIENHRGIEIKTPNNNPAIPIIDSCRELKYRIDFLADSNIVEVYDSSIVNPVASGSYKLKSSFKVDDQDSIDEITFKYVHIVIPCELEPGSYFITLDEVDDFIGNASFTETNILELTYNEPSVTIDISAPEPRDACYGNGVELDVNIEGGSDCAAYKLFVNTEDRGQYDTSEIYTFSYGDEVKVQILGGENFSNSILIDTSYFQPLRLKSTSHIYNDTLCPGEEVDFEISVGLCPPNRIDLYKLDGTELIAEEVGTEFAYQFNETDTIYAVLEYYFNDEYVYIQTNTYAVGEILSIGNRYKFLNSYVFPSTKKSIVLMELDYDTAYSEPFLGHRVIAPIPVSLGDTADTTKVYRFSSPGNVDYMFYRFDIPYTNFPASTIADTMSFDTQLGIRQGEGIPNFLKLYFGKYHSTYDKYCYDSTRTAVYVLRDDVFIPKSAFCSNDDEEYTIEINTDLKGYATTLEPEGENSYLFTTYAGYNIMIGNSYDPNHPYLTTDSSGHIINFKPNEWDTIGNQFTIWAKVDLELRTVTEPNCPTQWYKYNSYQEDDSVYHLGKVYRALQDIEGSGIIINPHEPEFTKSDEKESKGGVLPDGPVDPEGPSGPIVIYITPGVHTDYWLDLGTCDLGSFTSQSVEVGYASNKFDIIDPATDGKLLNFPTEYCLSDEDIVLESNYTIVDIIGGNDAINENDEGEWHFIPENMVSDGANSATGDVTLYYEDYYGCFAQTTYNVEVNQAFTSGQELDLSLEDKYCKTSKSIPITSNFELLHVIAPGVNDTVQPKTFIPEEALGDRDSARIRFNIQYRDNKRCWDDTRLGIIVNKNYDVDSSFNLSLNDNYCLTNNKIHVTNEVDTIIGPGISWLSDSIFFEPEVAADGLDYLDTSIYVEFRDNNKCWYSKNIDLTIDKEYDVQHDVELNLDSVYCPVDDSIVLSSNYSIISLMGDGITFEDNTYTFNPFNALNTEDAVQIEIPLVYRDNNGCLYDKMYNVEVNRFKLVDSSGYIENLENAYCLTNIDYPININDNDFSIDEIVGFGVYQDETTGQYYYNASMAFENATAQSLQDTIILKYFDDKGCPYTKIEVVDVDSMNVDAAANLLFDEQYCAVNNSLTIPKTEFSHNLYNVEGFGAIFDTVDSVCIYNPFSVYENAGIDTMAIYSEMVITDKVSAYFTDKEKCVYKKEYNVPVSGSFANNLNGELVDFMDEYCQYDNKRVLVGDPGIDTLIGPGLQYEDNNNRWYLDPAHEDFTNVGDDVSDSISYYYRDDMGCPWFATYDFNVYARPEPDFSVSDLCEGDFTAIANNTDIDGEGVIDTWEWIFGDLTDTTVYGDAAALIPTGTNEGNTTGTYSEPKHRYPGPGKYDLFLRVETDKGCENDTTKTVVIGGYPEVDFTFEKLLQYLGTTFTNNTTAEPFDEVVLSTWDWDDNGNEDVLQGSFDRDHNFNNLGVHNVKLKAITNNGCEDSIAKKVPIFEYITVSSDNIYEQKFDSQNHGWLAAAEFNDNVMSGWKYEEVSGNLDQFPNTDGYIWRTGDSADGVFGEDAWIESPGFDITQLDFPVLSIDIYQSVENGRDGAVVQYSLDDGDNWNLLGDTVDHIKEGINWYNQTGIISNPGNQTVTEKEGWSAYLNNWQTARFPLDKVREDARNAGAQAVRFRVAYASDEGNTQGVQYDGFAFDNFRLTSRSRIVLLEQFVNTVENYSLARNEERWLDEFLQNNPVEVVGINYHNYIADNYDSLYYLNTPDISSRSTEYGAYLTQLTMVDGLYRCISPSETEAKAYYRMRSLKDKMFNIDVETGFYNGALNIQATVTKLVDTLMHIEGTEKSVVRMALVQKEMAVNDTIFKNVLIELLPVGIGNVVGSIPAEAGAGDSFDFLQTWVPDNISTIGQEYRLVVYVQGIWGVDEVHQVWFQDLDNSLIPQVDLAMANATDDEEDNNESFSDESAQTQFNFDYLTIYPLPAENEFFLEWSQELEFDVNWQLISMSGQNILSGKVEKGSGKHLIKTEQIPAGVYLLMLYDKDLNYIEKRMIVVK